MTRFEKEVLAWIAANCGDPAVQGQLQAARISSRDHTGKGCYSELVMPAGTPPTQASYGRHGPLAGPGFESPSIEHGGGTLLWFQDGLARTLEVFTYTGGFPMDHDELGAFALRDDRADGDEHLSPVPRRP